MSDKDELLDILIKQQLPSDLKAAPQLSPPLTMIQFIIILIVTSMLFCEIGLIGYAIVKLETGKAMLAMSSLFVGNIVAICIVTTIDDHMRG